MGQSDLKVDMQRIAEDQGHVHPERLRIGAARYVVLRDGETDPQLFRRKTELPPEFTTEKAFKKCIGFSCLSGCNFIIYFSEIHCLLSPSGRNPLKMSMA